MNFQPVDRLPVWEWAMWWDKTIARWHGEGLPRELKHSQVFEIAEYFGLDPYQQFWFSTTQATIEATQHHTEGVVGICAEFDRIVPLMKSGGFIPSVDHQTPPGVSLEEYRIYVQILKEYSKL